jgi:hypothetical protein
MQIAPRKRVRPLRVVRVLTLGMVVAGLAAIASHASRPVLGDPALIRFRPGRLDVLRMHGAITPATPIDPVGEGFAIVLRNADGVLYHAALLPGDLSRARRATFLDRAAASGRGRRNGLFRVSLLRRERRYHFDVQAYADLAGATLPTMTVQIAIGDDVFVSAADWRRTRFGWARDF